MADAEATELQGDGEALGGNTRKKRKTRLDEADEKTPARRQRSQSLSRDDLMYHPCRPAGGDLLLLAAVLVHE